MGTPSSCSSWRMRPESVGWVTLQAVAARVKCFSRAKAAGYLICLMSMADNNLAGGEAGVMQSPTRLPPPRNLQEEVHQWPVNVIIVAA